MPSRRAQDQRADQAAEQRGIWAVGDECQLDAAGHLVAPHGDLEQPQPDRGELASGQPVCREWCSAACASTNKRQWQNKPHLVGRRGTATGAVEGQLTLVPLDRVLGLATGAVEAFIEPVGTAMRDVGDDIANIEPVPGGIDACHHPVPADRGFGPYWVSV